jgi:hypothetical protein
MNERIKLIAEQANLEIDPAHPDHNQKVLEKFAELIVKECIDLASIGNGHGNNQWDRALTFASNNIKEHFGVEE